MMKQQGRYSIFCKSIRRINFLSDYIVEPKSRKELRCLANALREHLGLENELWIPIVELLDVFAEIFDDFNYEIVQDNALPKGVHAETDIRSGNILIKESVYERACDGKGRDRMTIAHEIAHYFMLCFCGFKLQRAFDAKKVPPYMDPEWQAKCFAGEFMAAYHLTEGMSPAEIARFCGISRDAAIYQFKHRD